MTLGIQSSHRRPFTGQRLLLVLVSAYFLLSVYQMALDPLVRAPQLDAKENTFLADRFTQGETEKEPFYRAVLYPFLMSLVPGETARILFGFLLGTGCHLLNAFLVFAISRQIWKSPMAGLAGGSLYLIYPASLFYSALLLDITPGITCLLGGLYLLTHERISWKQAFLTGTLFGLAVLLRPHFLIAAAAIPFVLFTNSCFRNKVVLLALLPLMGLLLLQGWINHVRSGDFRILPWQGSYNLWAANKPGANGLYYKQELDLSGRSSDINPAKLESIILYGEAHPEEAPPYSIDRMNAYWRGKFIDHAWGNPLQLLKLWGYKGYAVLNSYEQYNNLTFSFHKERIPLLRYNPLNWGILLMLGACGMYGLFRYNRKAAWLLTACMASYGVMLILFYASARFRLPLVPFLAIAAGGCPVWVRDIFRNRRQAVLITAIALPTAIVAYSNLSGVRDRGTYVQDQLLMANANAELGRDYEAATWARAVLGKYPHRKEAVRTYAISYFNLQLTGDPRLEKFGSWAEQEALLTFDWVREPVLMTISGFYLWHWGEPEKARSRWQRAIEIHPHSAPLARIAITVANHSGGPLDTNQQTVFDLLHPHFHEN